ncbi:MAG: acyltransferase [Candidatus Binatia bacterium]
MDTHPADSRLLELDLLRGQAIVAVVTLHAGTRFYVAADSASVDGLFAIALRCIAIIGVPVFLMLSAATLTLAYPTAIHSPAALARFFTRRLRRVVVPYVSWSLLLLVISGASAWSLGGVARALATGSASYQYYFVPLICQFYLLFPLFQPLFRLSDRRAVALLLAAASMVTTMLWWRYRPAYFWEPFWLSAWLVYPFVGGLLAARLAAARTLARRRSRVWLVATGAAWLVLLALSSDQSVREHTVFAPTMYQPLVVALSLAAAALLFGIDTHATIHARGIAHMFREIGQHSYGIFLVHALALRGVSFCTGRWFVSGLGSAIALVDLTACLALSYLAIRTLSRIPVARTLLT